MGRTNNPAGPLQAVGQQQTAPADRHNRDRCGRQLHPVKRVFQALSDMGQPRFDNRRGQGIEPAGVAQPSPTGRNRQVGGGQLPTAKGEGLLAESIADAVWTDPAAVVAIHPAAPAQAD